MLTQEYGDPHPSPRRELRAGGQSLRPFVRRPGRRTDDRSLRLSAGRDSAPCGFAKVSDAGNARARREGLTGRRGAGAAAGATPGRAGSGKLAASAFKGLATGAESTPPLPIQKRRCREIAAAESAPLRQNHRRSRVSRAAASWCNCCGVRVNASAESGPRSAATVLCFG